MVVEKCQPYTLGLTSCTGTLYAVGGFAAPHYLSTVEAYDPNANQWWGVAPLRSPRRDLGLCAVEHRHMLVCAGGYDGNSYLGAVEVGCVGLHFDCCFFTSSSSSP